MDKELSESIKRRITNMFVISDMDPEAFKSEALQQTEIKFPCGDCVFFDRNKGDFKCMSPRNLAKISGKTQPRRVMKQNEGKRHSLCNNYFPFEKLNQTGMNELFTNEVNAKEKHSGGFSK